MYSQLSRILRQSRETLWAVTFDALDVRLFLLLISVFFLWYCPSDDQTCQ